MMKFIRLTGSTDSTDKQTDRQTDRMIAYKYNKTDTPNFNYFAPKINVLKMGFLVPYFAFLDENFQRRRFSDNFPITQNSGYLPPASHAMTPLFVSTVCPESENHRVLLLHRPSAKLIQV